MGRKDKQQHNKGPDVSGDCCGYGGSVEPFCNLNLDNRHERSRLHVLDDLRELDMVKELAGVVSSFSAKGNFTGLCLVSKEFAI